MMTVDLWVHAVEVVIVALLLPAARGVIKAAFTLSTTVHDLSRDVRELSDDLQQHRTDFRGHVQEDRDHNDLTDRRIGALSAGMNQLIGMSGRRATDTAPLVP